jgi:uncharacterized protein
MTADALDLHNLDLRDIAARAARASGAKRVILFGSRARGDARGDSDVDLLLVVSDDCDLMEAGLAAYRALFPPRVGFDILPIHEGDFLSGATLLGRVAQREGVVLYA